MRIKANGNVGIGNNDPQSKLSVAGQVAISGPSIGVVFKNTANGNKLWDVSQEAGMLSVNETGVQTVMTWAQGGYVGIGTKAPAYPLQINTANYKALKLFTTNPNSDVFMTANPTGQGVFRLNAFGGLNAIVFSNGDPDASPTGGTELMRIKGNGNVGIGNADPQYKLDVSGTLNVTGELTVASVKTKTWSIAPDYVFEKGYDLKSLDQVESYVQKNKHLPEVPSAKEIKAKGLDLAEMNLVLLRKVEELTLHAIRQEKELRKQAAEIHQLRLSRN